MKKLLPIIAFTLLVVACKSSKQIEKKMEVMNNTTKSTVNRIAIVYKTTKDFSDFVPVIMNAERTKIVSYPAPTDLSISSKPIALKNGYLLDNRGITENVVFLNYSYEAYMSMKVAPTLTDMQKNIKDKYPLKELIYCGSRYQYKDEVNELNRLIQNGFQGCKKADLIPMAVTLDL